MFSFYDPYNYGNIKYNQLGTILKQLGFEPQLKELEFFIERSRNKGNNKMWLMEFLSIVEELIEKMSYEQQIMR